MGLGLPSIRPTGLRFSGVRLTGLGLPSVQENPILQKQRRGVVRLETGSGLPITAQ